MSQDNPYVEYENAEAPKPKANPFSAFIPKGDYFFTPIILDLNILVFLAMIISGVSPWVPSIDTIMAWGGNNRNAVIQDGQVWRMFTAMFLHYGILHIATNMFTFWQIGRMLEPFVGKWRFVALYLMSGLGGSAVSIWWHPSAIGAGASGAIFGMFGVFAALLTTDIIDQSIRRKMLRSITIVIGVNLSIGLLSFIDNSAHIGGLLTGTIGGYLSYFDLKSWYYKRIKKYTGLIISACITASAIIILWMLTPKTLVEDPETLLKKFGEEDQAAALFYDSVPDSLKTAKQINTNLIARYNNCLSIAKSIHEMEISDEWLAIIEQFQTYSEMRLEGSQSLLRWKNNNSKESRDSVVLLNHQADSVLHKIEAMEKALNEKNK